jgi:hypothetical protein
MNRARLMCAATLLGASFAVTALAQTPAAPPMTSVLAGKEVQPALQGPGGARLHQAGDEEREGHGHHDDHGEEQRPRAAPPA